MFIPLADKLRPASLEDFVGQEHLMGKSGPIRKMLSTGKVYSMILWGPPGSGKTTIARMIANYIHAKFIAFSAVTGNVAEVRKIIAQAKELQQFMQQETVLFVDEIHRFNKAQQDAFLPYVEDGTIILIGATTENPGFEINAPLISRTKIYKLESLSNENLLNIANKAIKEYPKTAWDEAALNFIVKISNGDARVVLNAIEIAAGMGRHINKKIAEAALQKKAIYYDKKGDSHYDTISAFIKSMRGSDPDAALHYLARMIKAGEDPVFIARRMVIFASEDIGNAKPTALVLATSCMQAVHMIGMPEATLILAQTASYLATCPKSISSTTAIGAALSDIDEENLDPIPLHLRNPANKVMKQFGYGKGHIRYAWKEEKETGKKVDQKYLPENLRGRKYYLPDWE